METSLLTTLSQYKRWRVPSETPQGRGHLPASSMFQRHFLAPQSPITDQLLIASAGGYQQLKSSLSNLQTVLYDSSSTHHQQESFVLFISTPSRRSATSYLNLLISASCCCTITSSSLNLEYIQESSEGLIYLPFPPNIQSFFRDHPAYPYASQTLNHETYLSPNTRLLSYKSSPREPKPSVPIYDSSKEP